MNHLPIDDILPELKQALVDNDNVILSAQPGAGKTTRVPLALKDEAWLQGKKILMLEPRRIAARNAALFMAATLNEKVGQQVGYRMRLDNKVSSETRIEVITEGVLNRYLQQDPELNEVGLIIFDEHHERSLNTDLGLALCLQCQQLFRDDLKILVMSATLDKEPLEALLDAPSLHSDGRSYPVALRYQSYNSDSPLANQMASLIHTALQQETGSILAFLPGARDIQQVQQLLSARLSDALHNDQITIHPLFGQLNDKQQQAAIAPAPKGQRKIVLATNIAESSLTIEGIRVVVDSGLEKQLQYNPRSGMNQLKQRAISQASATQRAGRAGRKEDGVCYRLWSESQNDSMERHASAEISRVDLCDLVINISQWGVTADELEWLTPPPAAHLNQATDLLEQLGLIDKHHNLTTAGELCGQLGMHPRLALLLINACHSNHFQAALNIAAALQEMPKDLRNLDDVDNILRAIANSPARYPFITQQSRSWSGQISSLSENIAATQQPFSFAQLLALSFPDRIARLRSQQDGRHYQLSNGRSAHLWYDSPLMHKDWLVALEVEQDNQGGSIIRKAISIEESEVIELFADQIEQQVSIAWDESGQLKAQQQDRLFALTLSSTAIQSLDDEQWQDAWQQYLLSKGLSVLPWDEECKQLQARLNLLRENFDGWPDFSDRALLSDMKEWLLPIIWQYRSEKQLQKLDLKQALFNRLGWDKVSELDKLVPEKIEVPSGSKHKIDYSSHPPVLAVKLQEMFGYQGNPAVCNGKVELMLHLLSPAQRPLQVTQDLTGFWNGSYSEVRKEMRGRYPKHPWPENPLEAQATRHTKKRAGITR